MANKRPTERYVPGNVPDTLPGLVQFLYDELWRIATAINPFPISLNIEQFELLADVAPLPQLTQLFVGSVPIRELPGGAWDSASGRWVCPVSGVYQISINCRVEPFGAGNKIYQAVVSIVLDGDTADPVWSSTDNGPDDRPLGVNITLSGPVNEGQTLSAFVSLDDDQFTGQCVVDSYMSIAQAEPV
jgi:hypothetical protein